MSTQQIQLPVFINTINGELKDVKTIKIVNSDVTYEITNYFQEINAFLLNKYNFIMQISFSNTAIYYQHKTNKPKKKQHKKIKLNDSSCSYYARRFFVFLVCGTH